MSLDGPLGLNATERRHAGRRDVRRLTIAKPAVPTEPPAEHPEPDIAPLMRLEIRQVDEVKLLSLPSLAGSWAWLLFHGDGSLIAYSDGYAMRSNCVAAAKRIGWPIDISE